MAGILQKAIVVSLVFMTGVNGTLFAREVADARVLLPPPVLSGLILQSSDQNMERTLLIRRAFQEDKELGPHHIGIRYKDGLVTLWGPVERRALIDLARKKAALQKGVVEVRSELYLGRTGNRSVGPPSSGVPLEQPVRIQAASPNPQTGVLPTKSPREEKIQSPPDWAGEGNSLFTTGPCILRWAIHRSSGTWWGRFNPQSPGVCSAKFWWCWPK